MKFRIVEVDKNSNVIKVWYESNNIIIGELEKRYERVLIDLAESYDLFHKSKDLETQYTEDNVTWHYYGDTYIDYLNYNLSKR
jgi:hypothetical protein